MVPTQHAPHGVAVHDPPDDQVPPAVVHWLCVRNEHAPALQQVPHDCEMHAVPAPPQLPVHAACVVFVHEAPAQHEPIGSAGHGSGEHV